MSETMPSQKKTSGEDRFFSALCYPFWFVCFPIFSISPEKQAKPFVKFHAYQGLILGLLIWLGGIALWQMAAIFGRFILFGLLLYPALRLAEWAALLTQIFTTASAWLGYETKIPFVTPFVRSMLAQGEQSA